MKRKLIVWEILESYDISKSRKRKLENDFECPTEAGVSKMAYFGELAIKAPETEQCGGGK